MLTAERIVPRCQCGCGDVDRATIVGWCCHCDHAYLEYTPALESTHFAYHCPDAPEILKKIARARLDERGAKVFDALTKATDRQERDRLIKELNEF